MATSFRIESNIKEIQSRYVRRAAKLTSASITRPQMYAVALSNIRRQNIQKLIYQRTPYMAETGSKKPSFKLLEGEKVANGMVFNDVEYSGNRMRMTGTYAKSPGLSREADWGKASIEEFLPIMRLQQIQLNRSILEA